jgi:hypothetical protein
MITTYVLQLGLLQEAEVTMRPAKSSWHNGWYAEGATTVTGGRKRQCAAT